MSECLSVCWLPKLAFAFARPPASISIFGPTASQRWQRRRLISLGPLLAAGRLALGRPINNEFKSCSVRVVSLSLNNLNLAASKSRAGARSRGLLVVVCAFFALMPPPPLLLLLFLESCLSLFLRKRSHPPGQRMRSGQFPSALA